MDDEEMQKSREELQESEVQDDDEEVEFLKATKTISSRETVSGDEKPQVLKEKISKVKN